jgi:electron transfer flavoprotein beta subunit
MGGEMDILVCLKRVPDTAEATVIPDASGKDIIKDRLTFSINEADNYALEEALLLKEKYGGTVTLLSFGPKPAEEVLRMGMAKGADGAIRLWDEKFVDVDYFTQAKVLASACLILPYDLILTGCMATDDGYAAVGLTIAAILGIPSATYVSKIELIERKAKIRRELEGGLYEVKEINLPAVLGVQTGINTPRYPSILGIKRAASKEIKVLDSSALNLTETDFSAKTILEKLYLPIVEAKAEFLEGSPDEVSAKLAQIFKEKGVL